MSTTVNSADDYRFLVQGDTSLSAREIAKIEASESVWFEVIARFPYLRVAVANNKTVPASILRHLARDSDEQVRSMIAMRRKTPPDVLAELAHDPGEGVRRIVAYNAATPDSVLETLSNDPWAGVYEQARHRLRSRRD
jgi:hypothetical protein